MNELTYTMVGDYSLPNLKLPQQPEVTLGRYAQMRREFLKEHHCAGSTDCTSRPAKFQGFAGS